MEGKRDYKHKIFYSGLDKSKDADVQKNLEEYRNFIKGIDTTDASEENQKDPNPGIFRLYGKPDFDYFDNVFLKEHNWEVDHILTGDHEKVLKKYSGFKEYKATVNYKGPQGRTIMHRNKQTDIHKVIIHPNKLENHYETIQLIKSMFELGLGYPLYNNNDLPEGLKIRLEKIKESKLVDKLKQNKN